mgnify:CR=1 FL=1|tara:strand:+ start:284 stop:448 length:165 start_codon:yes stop_codon:yes gene_type:complete
MPKQITHLSLFPNDNCVVCSKEVKDNAIHCNGCLDKWLETKQDKNQLIVILKKI